MKCGCRNCQCYDCEKYTKCQTCNSCSYDAQYVSKDFPDCTSRHERVKPKRPKTPKEIRREVLLQVVDVLSGYKVREKDSYYIKIPCWKFIEIMGLLDEVE